MKWILPSPFLRELIIGRPYSRAQKPSVMVTIPTPIFCYFYLLSYDLGPGSGSQTFPAINSLETLYIRGGKKPPLEKIKNYLL